MTVRDLVPFYDANTDPITFYSRACAALEQCATLTEAWEINTNVAKIMALAKLAEKTELEVLAAEVRALAHVKIGLLSLALDKPQQSDPKTGRRLPIVGKAGKTQVLSDVGISTSTTQRDEQLAGGPSPEGQRAAVDARKTIFAACRERGEPLQLEDLRAAVHRAVAALDPSKKLVTALVHKTKRQKPQAMQFTVVKSDEAFFDGVEAAAAKIEAIAQEQKMPAMRALLEQTAKRVRREIRRPHR